MVNSHSKQRRRRNAAPVIALLLLSPVVGELLFGSVRITTLFVLVLLVGTWGCAAMLIRHVVRVRGRGWGSALLLALALAVAEECVIQQTSLAPLVGVDPAHVYSRAFGVNWVYLLWALGYESIWIVLLPIQLTELMFPAHRDEPWVGRRGVTIAGAVFALASFAAWYSWTQVFVPRFSPQSAYSPPLSAIAIALAAIAALAALALAPRPLPRASAAAHVPGPWPLGILAFVFGLGWCGLVLIAYGAAPDLPVAVPIAVGLLLAGAAPALLRRWGRSAEWQDAHRCALVTGALCGSMLVGFVVLKLGAAPSIDIIGKLVLNVAALLLLAWLARRVRGPASPPAS
jgi:hypothetical protein